MVKPKFKSFREVLDLWSTRALLAHRLSLPVNTVIRWVYANSVPPQYWRALCALSRGRVTIDNLLDIVEAKARRMPRINMEPRRQRQDFASP